MSKVNLKEISDLLTLRGFVTDEDVTYFSVGKGVSRAKQLNDWAIKREQQIRNMGYKGGKIKGWSTKFKLFGSAYGVVDGAWYEEAQDIYIERYLKITHDIKLCKGMTVAELKSYGLGVSFICDSKDCNHESDIPPKDIHSAKDSKFVANLTGECTKCQKPKIPISKVFKPWK